MPPTTDPAVATAIAELDVRILELRQSRLPEGEAERLVDEALETRYALLHPDADR